MTEWATFAGFAGVVLVLLLLLARASQRALSAGEESTGTTDEPGTAVDGRFASPGGEFATFDDRTATLDDRAASPDDRTAASGDGVADESDSPVNGRSLDLSTTELLANVAVSQGLFLGLLVIGIWLTNVPLAALGIAPAGASVPALDRVSWGVGVAALIVGVGVGGALYVFNEGGAALGDRLGLGSSEELREALAPDSAGGWAVLLLIVLPIVAGFEELLFRGALIGALAVGAAETGVVTSASAGVFPWVLAVGSSIAFALGHGAQGRGGIAVTGVLGFALAAVFVTTWSLPLVFVAHYLVNALEFVVHEGLDVDWA